MVRRAILFVILVCSFASISLARQICNLGGDCATPGSAPDFGTDPQHPTPPGGYWGGGPIFSLYHKEPFRNPDKGPLGVVLSTGEFQITVTDMEIPGRGFPFRLSRTYRSRSYDEPGLIGNNWFLNYDEYLTPGTYNPGFRKGPPIEVSSHDGLVFPGLFLTAERPA